MLSGCRDEQREEAPLSAAEVEQARAVGDEPAAEDLGEDRVGGELAAGEVAREPPGRRVPAGGGVEELLSRRIRHRRRRRA